MTLRFDPEPDLTDDWVVTGERPRLERVITNLAENAELAPNLFQKFVRGRRTLRKAGLGLYFCRITVEHRGGAISYEPRPAGGSHFWFRLPRPSPV